MFKTNTSFLKKKADFADWSKCSSLIHTLTAADSLSNQTLIGFTYTSRELSIAFSIFFDALAHIPCSKGCRPPSPGPVESLIFAGNLRVGEAFTLRICSARDLISFISKMFWGFLLLGLLLYRSLLEMIFWSRGLPQNVRTLQTSAITTVQAPQLTASQIR